MPKAPLQTNQTWASGVWPDTCALRGSQVTPGCRPVWEPHPQGTRCQFPSRTYPTPDLLQISSQYPLLRKMSSGVLPPPAPSPSCSWTQGTHFFPEHSLPLLPDCELPGGGHQAFLWLSFPRAQQELQKYRVNVCEGVSKGVWALRVGGRGNEWTTCPCVSSICSASPELSESSFRSGPFIPPAGLSLQSWGIAKFQTS